MSRQEIFPTFYSTAYLLRRIARFCGRLLPVAGLLLLAIYVVANQTAGSALERELARIREQGEPLTLREAAPPPVPEDENAAVLYARAFERLPRLVPAPSSGQPNPRLSSADERVLKALFSERGNRVGDVPIAQLRDLLTGTDEALALFRKAAAMPRCRFPVDWEAGAGALFPHYPRLLVLTRLTAAHAILAAAEGRPDDAVAGVSAILGMARHLADEPIMIGLLIQYRCLTTAESGLQRVLETSTPSDEACRELDRQLSDLDLLTPLERTVQTERCLGLWCFDAVASSNPPNLPELLGGDDPLLRATARLGPIRNPLARMDELFYLRTMARMEDRARRRDRTPAEETESGQSPIPWYASVSRIVLPDFNRLRRQRDQALARVALARCGLALAEYRRQAGSFPTSLADAERTAGRTLPRDPLTGQDLVYRPHGTGYLLYSLGLNGRDDGGRNASDRDHRSSGTASKAKDDLAWWFNTEGSSASDPDSAGAETSSRPG